MDVSGFWTRAVLWFYDVVNAVTLEQWYWVWLIGGAVWFIGCGYALYVRIRVGLGHVKFRGTWLDSDQHAELVAMIDEDSKRGNRVMRHDEMSLLRRWRFGSDKVIMHKAGSYF